MGPERRRFGRENSAVVLVDGVTGDPDAAVDLAAALAPFPAVRGNYYPGLRRVIADADLEAMAYVRRVLEAAAPYIAGGFDCNRFDLLEASFSMVTTPPESLVAAQRGAHFDSVDPDYLAVMHYLTDTAGTAFYRQRSTGIERVSAANLNAFVAHARQQSESVSGYLADSDAAFEQIGFVEGVADRLVIYQGCLLHSGLIASDQTFSPDPRQGRLTANFFVQLRR